MHMKKKIKKFILRFFLILFKLHLAIIYFFIKLFTKQKDEVFFLSRQSDNIPGYFRDLMKKLDKCYKYGYNCVIEHIDEIKKKLEI